MKTETYWRNQLNAAILHEDIQHIVKCEDELSRINPCGKCPHLVVSAVPSSTGDGYGNSFQYCSNGGC